MKINQITPCIIYLERLRLRKDTVYIEYIIRKTGLEPARSYDQISLNYLSLPNFSLPFKFYSIKISTLPKARSGVPTTSTSTNYKLRLWRKASQPYKLRFNLAHTAGGWTY